MKRRKYFACVLAVLFFACILGIMMYNSEHRIKMAPEISEGQAAAREAVKTHAGEDVVGGAGDEETLQTAAEGEAEHAEPSQSVAAEESEHEEPVEPVTLDRAECEASIQMLLEENRNEISEWFEKYPLWQRRVDFSCFDFTGDGQMEIILSYTYVETATPLSYNYVFNDRGSLLFSFVSARLSSTELYEIYADGDTDIFYIQNHLHIAAHHDIAIYEEITQKEGWNVELILVEWDTRDEASRDKNVQVGYGVYTEFSQEEEDVFMRKNYYEGILEVLHAKEASGTTQQISEYEKIYENLEMREVVYLGCLLEWEEGMQWEKE